MKTVLHISFLLLFITSVISSSAQTEMWGMTYQGGSSGLGVIFKTDSTGNNIQVAHSFAGGLDGSYPDGGLVQVSNRKLYGVTSSGGGNSYGTLFEYDLAFNTYTKLYDFDSTNGGSPVASVIAASDGKLYGMTAYGGAFNLGTIFKYDPDSNIFSKLYDFDTTYTNGVEIHGSLCQAANGNLYGMTAYGGANDNGVVFEFDLSSNTYTKVADFGSLATGRYPWGSLYTASNGKLYGMTFEGGVNIGGTLFEFDPSNNVITKLHDFAGIEHPFGNNVMEASNGKLYGTTPEGGINTLGGLFEYDILASTLTPEVDFVDSSSWPVSSLTESTDGNLYGLAEGGNPNNTGVIFQYNPLTNSFAVVSQFHNLDGSFPDADNHLTVVHRVPLSVWPGDCNYDLTVDNADFLYLGLAWNDTGSVRSAATINYTAQPATDWINSFSSGVNHKHADTNGDGVVDINDAAAISLNYGQSHPFRPAHQNTIGDFYLVPNQTAVAPGDAVTFKIHLANSSVPVDSIYGIAFSLLFDQSLTDTTNLSLSFSPSVLGTINTDMKSFEKDFYSSGKIDAALTRIDHTNALNVYGVLGTLTIFTSPSVTSLSTLHVTPSNVSGLTADENPVAFAALQDSVVIDPLLAGIKTISGDNGFAVFPNPANEHLTVQVKNEIIRKVELIDVNGKSIFQSQSNSNRMNFSMKELSGGIYILSVLTDQNSYHKKIQVVH